MARWKRKTRKIKRALQKIAMPIFGGGERNGYIPVKYKSPKVTHLEAENLRGPIKILQITKAV